MKTLASLLLVAATACGAGHAERADVDALRRDMAQHDVELAEVERTAAQLSAEWRAVAFGLGRARDSYARARGQFELAEQRYGTARETYAAAAAEWDRARILWDFYRSLVFVAAQVDAAAMNGAAVCQSTSTQSFRRQLESRGENLAGKDIDHIVPRSLGGADNPSNYQVLSSSVNRSQGAWWGFDKCLSVGTMVCAAAVAVSMKCGGYSMLP